MDSKLRIFITHWREKSNHSKDTNGPVASSQTKMALVPKSPTINLSKDWNTKLNWTGKWQQGNEERRKRLMKKIKQAKDIVIVSFYNNLICLYYNILYTILKSFLFQKFWRRLDAETRRPISPKMILLKSIESSQTKIYLSQLHLLLLTCSSFTMIRSFVLITIKFFGLVYVVSVIWWHKSLGASL